MAKAWLTRAFAVMRRDTKPVSEFVRKSKLAETDPDQFQRALSDWIERHPEWRAVSRSEQITAWLARLIDLCSALPIARLPVSANLNADYAVGLCVCRLVRA